jgi:hypothetical protein
MLEVEIVGLDYLDPLTPQARTMEFALVSKHHQLFIIPSVFEVD